MERLHEQGNFPAAVAAARVLVENAESAGEDAYGAAYDIAMAYWTLGRALMLSGDPEAALGELQKARIGFHTLADAGGKNPARMASVVLSDIGYCLCDLGRLEEAAKAYEDSVERCRSSMIQDKWPSARASWEPSGCANAGSARHSLH